MRGKRKLVIEQPTREEQRRSAFEVVDVVEKLKGGKQVTIGKAYRRRPMIDVLHDTGVLTVDQLKALRHYRHHADIADRSPVRDSLSLTRGGGGDGLTVEMLNAQRVVTDCERAAGVLAPILRAVVVYDRSLSDWAVGRGGSVEKCRDRAGRRVCKVEATPAALRIARLDIQMAAVRVQAELDA